MLEAVEQAVQEAPPPGYHMTELGLLPEDWQVVRLREVTLKTRQFNPATNPDSLIRYVDVSAISAETLSITEAKPYLGKDAPGRARKQIQAQDVIFATIRPYLRRVAQVPTDLDGELCSTAFCVIRADRALLHPAATTTS